MCEKILIVDREPDILKDLTALLTKKGYKVEGVCNGKEAIESFNSGGFDLVITEIRIPDRDGHGLIRELKMIDGDLEIIVLTGAATVNRAVRALKKDGAFDFLTKPLKNGNQLIRSVEQALKRRKLLKEKSAFLEEVKQANEKLESRVSEIADELGRLKEQLRAMGR